MTAPATVAPGQAAIATGPRMLDVRQDGRVAILTMNRPRQRNAMSAELVALMIAASRQAAEDPCIGAILLTGAPPGFCAGSDLVGLAAMDAAARSQFEAESGRLARLFGELPIPVIAAAAGFAIGGGLTLATACDLVVTEEPARWSLPEVPIGLFPAWGLHAVVARAGLPVTRRLAWGLETLTGGQAVQLGLADHLAETDVVKDALRRAQALAALPRPQLAAVKTYCRANPAGADADALANQLFMQMCATPQAIQTLESFSRRARPPT